MDVQTRLLAPICPHYAEFIRRDILKKDGFVVKAGWPKENKLKCLIFVHEQFDGWKADCLSILQNKFNSDTRSFPRTQK